MAVEAFYDAETVWMCDIDKYSSIVIKERWGLPNLGDLKTVDWAAVEPIDILTAGYPCQPFSTAGQRKGLNDERHIWPYIKEIISTLQPKRIILENVRGHLTLGFKEVLKDLTEIGYDARWAIVRASDVGAPHRRERLFVLAQPSNSNGERGNFRGDRTTGNQGESQPQSCGSGSIVTNTQCERLQGSSGQGFRFEQGGGAFTNPNSPAHQQSRRANQPISQSTSQIFNGSDRDEYGGSGEIATNSDDSRGFGSVSGSSRRFNSRTQMRMQDTPNPLDINNKLNAKFVEYMMGLPVGWVTNLDISRSQQLKLLGNGVVPQQAYYAIDKLERL
jgi:DNA (cytosine-5)-methyltransferase 1